MNKEQYLKEREALLAKAKGFVDTSDMEAFKAVEAEVNTLDETFDAFARAQANLDALTDDPRVKNLANYSRPIIGGTVAATLDASVPASDDGDLTNSTEYRRAFMNHVATGKAIPTELKNANANTTTGDVATAIPTVLINRIIEKMETIGMILPLVTRTSYQAGINIPTSNVKPVATWVAEGAGSDRQKKTTGVITFTHHKLRCEISMTMEVSVMALPVFESTFVRQVSEAMVKATESKIVSTDTGAASVRGILAETPETGQAIKAAELNFQLLIDAEAAIPQAYEAGVRWFMSKKTFMGFVAMTDDSGQPIARVNYGIGGSPERTLLGRSVVLTGDYMPSFSATLAADTIFAFLFRPEDYMLNTIYDMGIQRKQDWDTEDMLTKAVMSIDGKVIDSRSLVTIAKKASG